MRQPLRSNLVRLVIVAAMSLSSAAILHPANLHAEADAPRVTTFVVDRNDDANIQTCSAAPNDCTLRGAINKANATVGGEDITFADNYTITLASLLPEFIDTGTYILGNGLDIRINANNVGQAFRISGNDTQIVAVRVYGAGVGASHIWINDSAYGVTIANNIIGAATDVEGATTACISSPNAFGGIYVSASGVVPAGRQRAYIFGNSIRCNGGNPGNGIDVLTDRVYIGINAAGVTGPIQLNDIRSNKGVGIRMSGASQSHISANSIASNGGDGVLLENGTETVNVGCAGAYGEGNMISFNAGHGIRMESTTTSQNVIGCNFIGTDGAGNTAYGNNQDGVNVASANQNFFVNNIISNNGGAGVNITNNAFSNTLISNKIGVNIALAPAPNAAAGISVTAANSNTIGSDAGTMQTIAHNRGAGIYIGVNAFNNVVSYTTSIHNNGGTGVGLDNAARRNVVHAREIYRNAGPGITVWNAFDNVLGVVGSGLVTQSMFIHGNVGPGILVHGSQNTFVDYSVYIGVLTDGETPASNNGPGVLLRQNTRDSLINPTVNSFNNGAGVAIEGDTSTGNRVYANRVIGNAGLPIDLGNDGPTANDPNDTDIGPNTRLNYPVVTSVSGSTVSGTACASCVVYAFYAAGNPGAPFGGTYRYLGGVIATASGTWNFPLPSGVSSSDLTWLACSQAGCPMGSNTSELSPRPVIRLPIVLRQ